MTPTEQAALAVFVAINERSLERVRDLVTDDFVDHGAPPGLAPPGPGGYIAVLSFVTDVLEMRYEIECRRRVRRPGRRAATGHGVHRSDHLGFPATGNAYAMASMHLFRGKGSRLAEHWGVRDELGALSQVGALALPPLPVLSAD